MPVQANLFGFGGPEGLIVLFVILLLFGATKLPQLARALGQSAKELKKGMNEVDDIEPAKAVQVTDSAPDALPPIQGEPISARPKARTRDIK